MAGKEALFTLSESSGASSRSRFLRIANCSGFFGDRSGAAREMVEGGPVDVLTGDWLAELTMYILHKTRHRTGGYAHTFLRELEDVLPTCIERGITVVSNAGGLNPEGLAEAVRELGRRQGVDVRVASVSGDDLTPKLSQLRATGEEFKNLDTGEPLPELTAVVTANAYLPARPIANALAAGAQVVVTGRVTDAALVVGPAMHAFGWEDSDFDAIAGAVVAGHVIECGGQCCGGNFAFFEEIPNYEHIGFPIAEVYADGTSLITKHRGTGGMVTVGTVTAQLLYEISGPRYISPDAVARFDSIALRQEGRNRVRITGVRGEPPPPTLKVTANLEAGWRNSMTLAITGPRVAQKARMAAGVVWASIPGGRMAFNETMEELSGDLDGDGNAFLRLAVRGDDKRSVGRAFSEAVIGTTLANYPGTFFTSAPTSAQGAARYWPTTVAVGAVTPRVECEGIAIPVERRAESLQVASGSAPLNAAPNRQERAGDLGSRKLSGATMELISVPLGVLVGARSGDKGADANVGLWADDEGVASWLENQMTVDFFRGLLPEVAPFNINRHSLSNLWAVNFVIHGLLGWGVASNLRLDAQAKGLGELLRSRRVAVPPSLVASGGPALRLARVQPSAGTVIPINRAAEGLRDD